MEISKIFGVIGCIVALVSLGLVIYLMDQSSKTITLFNIDPSATDISNNIIVRKDSINFNKNSFCIKNNCLTSDDISKLQGISSDDIKVLQGKKEIFLYHKDGYDFGSPRNSTPTKIKSGNETPVWATGWQNTLTTSPSESERWLSSFVIKKV